METNPVNPERVIRTDSQLLWWLAGKSLHNGQHRGRGECCPDFSCCEPDLLQAPEKRIEYVLQKLKENVVEGMRTEEPGYGEEVDLAQQEFFVRCVSRWFDDLIYDTVEPNQ